MLLGLASIGVSGEQFCFTCAADVCGDSPETSPDLSALAHPVLSQ